MQEQTTEHIYYKDLSKYKTQIEEIIKDLDYFQKLDCLNEVLFKSDKNKIGFELETAFYSDEGDYKITMIYRIEEIDGTNK
jgi:predicted acetyltransferase